MHVNEITSTIIGAAICVHRQLGPGLLESVYQQCMKMELPIRGLHFQDQVPITIRYRGAPLDAFFRADLVV